MNNHDSKLQKDIDGILASVHHLFDDIAEYAYDNDPNRVIDLDKALQYAAPAISAPARPQPVIAKPSPAAKKDEPVFPKNPQKVVTAMPLELQEEVRVYESQISAATHSQNIFSFLSRRLQF